MVSCFFVCALVCVVDVWLVLGRRIRKYAFSLRFLGFCQPFFFLSRFLKVLVWILLVSLDLLRSSFFLFLYVFFRVFLAFGRLVVPLALLKVFSVDCCFYF